MIVTPENIDSVISRLALQTRLAVDTETTGLFAWKADRLFAVAISDSEDDFYFPIPPFEESSSLPRKETLAKIGSLFQGNKILYMHNAKFDMAMLYQEGIEISCPIHDTEVGARLERNDHLEYSLDACLSRIGLAKSSEVEEYIKEHKLWEWRTVPGKKTRKKNKFFYKVPFEIISRYAMADTRGTYCLGQYQEGFYIGFDERHALTAPRPLQSLVETERACTKTLFHVERRGIKIDREYCKEAIAALDKIQTLETSRFEELTGFPFKDSGKHLAQVFSAHNIEIPLTDKGRPSFSESALEFIPHPAVEQIRKIRDAAKRANTYFRSFLELADDNGFLHTNLRQGGTGTGRLSSAEPNLQNLTKDEDLTSVSVRRAFVPNEGNLFVMIDYDQMEFRMLLDYAGEMGLIRKIKDGLDPHQATADMTGLTRRAAKTLNFALLYGVGITKLAHMLNVTEREAKMYKEMYFGGLPRVERFLRRVMRRAEQTGLLRSWDGRAHYFEDPNFAYKGANYIIQGGCAGVMKRALVDMDEFLRGRKTTITMTVHDEALFNMHPSETHLIPELCNIMQRAYPHRYIPLTASPSYSFTSWGEPVEGVPDAREKLQIEHGSTVA